MSPEQCEGSLNLSEKSDVYALGILFFEIFTGEYPYGKSSGEALVYMFGHVSRRPARVRQFEKSCPERLDDLFYRMIDKVPEQRPSMDEICCLLREFLTGNKEAYQGSQLDISAGTSNSLAARPGIEYFLSIIRRLSPQRYPLISTIASLILLILISPIWFIITDEFKTQKSGRLFVWSSIAALALIVGLSTTIIYFAKQHIRRQQPTRSSIRRLLSDMLLTESEFDAFCVDFFPEIKRRYFEGGMDRVRRQSILIECAEAHTIIKCLRKHSRVLFDRKFHLITYD